VVIESETNKSTEDYGNKNGLPLAAYSMLNNKLHEQVKERYTLIAFFTTLNGLLLGGIGYASNSNNFFVQIFIASFGLATSLIWLYSIECINRWKNEWEIELKTVEKDNFPDKLRCWSHVLASAKDRGIGSLSKSIRCIAIIFCISWVVLGINSLINYLN